MKLHVLGLALLLSTQAFASESLKLGLDEVIERAITEKRIVGTVVMVLKEGKIIYKRAAGLANREAARPMEMDTVFRLSSLSKPIVATAALALVDKGILKLHEPISKYLPEFRPKLPDGSEAAITIHHLLTHTAGMGYGFFEPAQGPYRAAGVSDGMDRVEFSLEENLRRIATIPLYYPPGAAWTYSVATDVLGAIMARATGKSLPEVIKSEVSAPLKMFDTSFVGDASRVATPYVNTDNGPVKITDGSQIPFGPSYVSFSPSKDLDESSYPSAGAGILSTAPDYIKLLEEIRQNKGTILSQESYAALTNDQIPKLNLSIFPGSGWSYGFLVVRDSAQARTHSSKGTLTWSGVYGHNFWIDLEKEMTVVVLTNTTFEGMLGQFAQEIQATIYKK